MFEKYVGNVRLLNDGKHDAHYLAEDNNPAIISEEIFQAVQMEKQHRSNVSRGEEGNRRKSEKYSFEEINKSEFRGSEYYGKMSCY